MKRRDYGLPREVVGWIYNHTKRNYWRVQRLMEFDDLFHEGLLCAFKCREHYGSDLDAPHYMSLVKTTFFNHIGDILRKNRSISDGPAFSDLVVGNETESDVINRLVEPDDPLAELMLLVNELPEHLYRVIMLYTDNESLERLRKRARVYIKTGEETLSQRLSRLCGFPPELDFETELRAYIWKRGQTDDIDDLLQYAFKCVRWAAK